MVVGIKGTVFKRKSRVNVGWVNRHTASARYFLIIKASFGGDRRTFATNKKNLAGTIDRLDDIKDFENLIKVYDRPKALFYLDPPYHGTEKYYDNSFTDADHIRLRDTLVNIKGKFILSYNNDDFVKDLYKGFNIIEISRQNNLSNETGAQFKEVIIKNY